MSEEQLSLKFKNILLSFCQTGPQKDHRMMFSRIQIQSNVLLEIYHQRHLAFRKFLSNLMNLFTIGNLKKGPVHFLQKNS